VHIEYSLLLLWTTHTFQFIFLRLTYCSISSFLTSILLPLSIFQIPPLLFTMMNENGIDIRIGLASFGGYFLISLISLFMMGSYDSIALATCAHEKEQFMTSTIQQTEEIKRSMSENDVQILSLPMEKSDDTMRRSKSVTYVESLSNC